LSLDLFGTIVFFDPERVPRRKVGDEDRVVTVAGIETLLSSVAPEVTLTEFLDALTAAGTVIAQEKRETHREVPTAARFVRALAGVGASGPVESVAGEMAERHMATLATAVVCPPDRRELVAALSASYPLALVSNFDHAATARGLLDGFGLTGSFRSIRISAEVGAIKPSREIFLSACRDLGCSPAAVLHVGDSTTADIDGAVGAGMRALWVGSGRSETALDSIADLRLLPGWLRERYR
jgi:putative hydrolase of the HAD superfamily